MTKNKKEVEVTLKAEPKAKKVKAKVIQTALIATYKLDARKAQGWVEADVQPKKYVGTDLVLCTKEV